MSTAIDSTTTTITIDEVTSDTQLHEHYASQTHAQPAYVQLDPSTRVLSCGVNGEIGSGVPARVWHGLVIRWTIPALHADPANALMSEIAELAERVCDGWSEVWDGSNHVGQLDDDASEARYEIQDICQHAGDDPTDQIVDLDASEWLGGLGRAERQRREYGITSLTTDEELSALETRIEEEARDEGAIVLRGLARHLCYLRATADRLPECASCSDTACALDDDGDIACADHATHCGPVGAE